MGGPPPHTPTFTPPGTPCIYKDFSGRKFRSFYAKNCFFTSNSYMQLLHRSVSKELTYIRLYSVPFRLQIAWCPSSSNSAILNYSVRRVWIYISQNDNAEAQTKFCCPNGKRLLLHITLPTDIFVHACGQFSCLRLATLTADTILRESYIDTHGRITCYLPSLTGHIVTPTLNLPPPNVIKCGSSVSNFNPCPNAVTSRACS